jgi:hypothetical protein
MVRKGKHELSEETLESVKQDALNDLLDEHDKEEMSEQEEYEDEWDARDFL